VGGVEKSEENEKKKKLSLHFPDFLKKRKST
jgi:hypothetical protein